MQRKLAIHYGWWTAIHNCITIVLLSQTPLGLRPTDFRNDHLEVNPDTQIYPMSIILTPTGPLFDVGKYSTQFENPIRRTFGALEATKLQTTADSCTLRPEEKQRSNRALKIEP